MRLDQLRDARQHLLKTHYYDKFSVADLKDMDANFFHGE